LAKHKEDLAHDLAAIQLPRTLSNEAEIATLEAAVNSKAEARARECLRPGPICHQYENEETELRRKLAHVHASRAAYDQADRLKAGIATDQDAIDALPDDYQRRPTGYFDGSVSGVGELWLAWTEYQRRGCITDRSGRDFSGSAGVFANAVRVATTT